MEKNSTPLVDDHLQSIDGMQEAETDAFFYTRLKARMLARQTGMGGKQAQPGWSFSLRPALVISTLLVLLAVNGFILSQQFKSGKTSDTKSASGTSSLESFANSYDQTISSSY